MFWGDIGVGKSTLAIQLAKEYLEKNLKVFFIHSKKTPMNILVKRILGDELSQNNSNLFVWNPSNFQQQNDVIMQWQIQIKELSTLFGEQRVGLIVIDEIASLYLLEMGTERQNEKLNRLMTLQLATLRKIAQEFQMPVVLLNSLTIRKDEQENPHGTPYGGKIVDYWVEFETLMERTAQMSKIRYVVKKTNPTLNIPSKWLWNLSDNGFI